MHAFSSHLLRTERVKQTHIGVQNTEDRHVCKYQGKYKQTLSLCRIKIHSPVLPCVIGLAHHDQTFYLW